MGMHAHQELGADNGVVKTKLSIAMIAKISQWRLKGSLRMVLPTMIRRQSDGFRNKLT
jgi:hypothetical protein